MANYKKNNRTDCTQNSDLWPCLVFLCTKLKNLKITQLPFKFYKLYYNFTAHYAR